ncbi:uncharacterized protein LOC129589165 isoform X2 [Paramacrobiotus metropolitanus]|uniref:uncharacterized protein LOC129589165 isoform X2 n=1 Tax=Paramacrobiotus metropolitanus TaxID=2943436 RepID=UPI002445F19E|nr:uncharacterized protein LOC129589165 isoform X2 [Paramacrobiotus metropolitanus]
MCRILTKRRLEYYANPLYDKVPLFKEGDIVWVYEKPPRTSVWMVYEAKIKARLAQLMPQYDNYLRMGADIPVYDVEFQWTVVEEEQPDDDDVQVVEQRFVNRFFEQHIYDPKRLTAEEMFCHVGMNNQNVLYNLTDAQKEVIPKEGLVFIGNTQYAELLAYLERSGKMIDHSSCDTDLEISDEEAVQESDADEEYRGRNKGNSNVWKKRRTKAHRRRRSKSSPKKPSPLKRKSCPAQRATLKQEPQLTWPAKPVCPKSAGIFPRKSILKPSASDFSLSSSTSGETDDVDVVEERRQDELIGRHESENDDDTGSVDTNGNEYPKPANQAIMEPDVASEGASSNMGHMVIHGINAGGKSSSSGGSRRGGTQGGRGARRARGRGGRSTAALPRRAATSKKACC